MSSRQLQHFADALSAIREDGLYKEERVLLSAQSPRVGVAPPPAGANEFGHSASPVLNLCANNYLGLANHPEILAAAREALDRWGYGLASVRFICGTQAIHKELEARLSAFLGTEDTILYSSCFDANAGLFETLLGEEDAILSDELNHASIIDGVRLCKARRYRYRNNDMADLEAKLREASGARLRLIATDGVFSMDGSAAKLREICDLADRHDALVMVDDSHAVGVVGATGRGTPELCGVEGRIDLLTGTLGKALGGASGGYASGRRECIELLRQRSRPYLFSNSLAPPIVAASIRALDLLERSPELLERLRENTALFREELARTGLEILPGDHPIVPVMLGDARAATAVASNLLRRGIYVVGFSFPVVPQGKARIRTQVSAAHEPDELRSAAAHFAAAAQEEGVLNR